MRDCLLNTKCGGALRSTNAPTGTAKCITLRSLSAPESIPHRLACWGSASSVLIVLSAASDLHGTVTTACHLADMLVLPSLQPPPHRRRQQQQQQHKPTSAYLRVSDVAADTRRPRRVTPVLGRGGGAASSGTITASTARLVAFTTQRGASSVTAGRMRRRGAEAFQKGARPRRQSACA